MFLSCSRCLSEATSAATFASNAIQMSKCDVSAPPWLHKVGSRALTLGPLESEISSDLILSPSPRPKPRGNWTWHKPGKCCAKFAVGMDWNGLEWHVPRAFHLCHFIHLVHLIGLCAFGTLSGKPWTETQLQLWTVGDHHEMFKTDYMSRIYVAQAAKGSVLKLEPQLPLACPALLRSLPIATENERGRKTLWQDNASVLFCVCMNLQQGVSPNFLDSMLCASVQFRAPPLCGSSWLRNPFARFISILGSWFQALIYMWPWLALSIRPWDSARPVTATCLSPHAASPDIACLGISQLPTEGLYLKAKSCKAKSNDHRLPQTPCESSKIQKCTTLVWITVLLRSFRHFLLQENTSKSSQLCNDWFIPWILVITCVALL